MLALLLLISVLGIVQYLKPASSQCGLHDGNRLKQIVLLCQIYATEHDGQYPSSPNDLVPYVGTNAHFFASGKHQHRVGSLDQVSEWTDFIYVPGSRVTDSEDTLLVYLPLDLTLEPPGAYVGFTDGKVQRLNQSQFVQTLDRHHQRHSESR